MIRLQNFIGSEMEPHLEALGGLRIRVFREYPYLYDGSLEYEREYLQTYLNSVDSCVVLAFDEDQVVGATTCIPLSHEGSEFQEPFIRVGIPVGEVCYFGESILLPRYRGQGLGKVFFQLREAHARSLPGIRTTAFCAVDRLANDPRRPLDYRPLDGFWTSQGYQRRPDLQAHFVWKETTEEVPTSKTLTFWIKSWPAL
ncbi:MAG: GNAT family N-acetyltransferase [Verrucomicrobiales bacterium]|nr:GNAT family N-acetyltransferase [Verrucomicrobiales bacterium]MCP5556997.1 GNAT family N-acetyltransferase [Verrucomicrobiaceae bacterium]